jgi:hypothetical protein
VAEFQAAVSRFEGIELVLGCAGRAEQCAFTQVVLRIDETLLGRSKLEFKESLYSRGIPVWHANFEPINSISLFRTALWEEWLPRCDLSRTRANYAGAFPAAYKLMRSDGLGLGKMNFLSRQNLRYLIEQIERILRSRKVA